MMLAPPLGRPTTLYAFWAVPHLIKKQNNTIQKQTNKQKNKKEKTRPISVEGT